jgi:hypothetical protein
MKRLLVSSVVMLAYACDGIASDDPSMMLTGTEQDAVSPPPGSPPGMAPSCPSSKVLICHIPPGNPANAHSICVGPPAWPPHHQLHGDTMGACPSGPGGSGDSDAGAPPPPPPPPDAGPPVPACLAPGSACNTDSVCCNSLPCNMGFCTPVIP